MNDRNVTIGEIASAIASFVADKLSAQCPFTLDDVAFLRSDARWHRERDGSLIAESFDLDGIADRIERYIENVAHYKS